MIKLQIDGTTYELQYRKCEKCGSKNFRILVGSPHYYEGTTHTFVICSKCKAVFEMEIKKDEP